MWVADEGNVTNKSLNRVNGIFAASMLSAVSRRLASTATKEYWGEQERGVVDRTVKYRARSFSGTIPSILMPV